MDIKQEMADELDERKDLLEEERQEDLQALYRDFPDVDPSGPAPAHVDGCQCRQCQPDDNYQYGDDRYRFEAPKHDGPDGHIVDDAGSVSSVEHDGDDRHAEFHVADASEGSDDDDYSTYTDTDASSYTDTDAFSYDDEAQSDDYG